MSDSTFIIAMAACLFVPGLIAIQLVIDLVDGGDDKIKALSDRRNR